MKRIRQNNDIKTLKSDKMNIKQAVIVLLALWSNVNIAAERPADAPEKYHSYMRTLIQMAKNPSTRSPFTAMIIDNQSGDVLCVGLNPGSASPIDHGELVAIERCVRKYTGKVNWQNTTLVTTAEPCPMCQGAISWANISTVVYGTSIPFLIQQGWKQINLRAYEVAKKSNFNHIQIVAGVLKEDTDKLFVKSNPHK